MPEKPVHAVPRPQRELYEKGTVALQRQNFDYAIQILTQVLVNEPAFFECRQALRVAQHKKSGGSTSFFKKMIGGASSQPQLAKAQMNLRKNPAEALQIAEQVLNGDPANGGAHRVVVEAAQALDLPRTAILSLEILVKASPKDKNLLMDLANALADAGQVDKAENVFNDALRLRPGDPEILQAMKNLSARRTLNEQGYEALSDGSGSYRDILRNKEEAVALEQEQRQVKTEDVSERLIREYEARLAVEPHNLKILRNLAELSTQRQDFDGALAYYERMRESDGGADSSLERAIADTTARKFEFLKSQIDPASADFEAQSEQMSAEKLDYQLAECQRRAEKYPTDLLIRFELGALYFQAGKISEAIQEFQKAQANPSKRLPAMLYLGKCFSRRGMNDMSARKFQEAIKEKPVLDDEKKELLYELGSVFEKMGKAGEAIEQFKQIYEVDIGYRDVAARVDAFYAAQ